MRQNLSSLRQQAQILLNEQERNQTTVNNIQQLQSLQQQNTAAKHQKSTLVNQLNQVNTELHAAQARYQQAESTAQRLADERNYLDNELQGQKNLFSTMTSLLNQYREFEGIELHPAVVMAQKLDPEELAHTDVLKVTCKEQCREAFDKVLAKITNINFQDSEGKTILMHAIINGFYYGVDKLLQKEANVNLLDNQGNNALIYCSQLPHIKYFKQIAEKTTNINLKSELLGGMSAIHLLALNTNRVIFASEVNNDLRNTNDQYEYFIMDENCLVTKSYMKKSLLPMNYSTTLTIVGGTKDAPLIIGAETSFTQEKTSKMIEFLVNKGGDINQLNSDGITALHQAIVYKKLNTVQTLMNLNADFNIPTIQGYYPWHFASMFGCIDIMKFLKNKIPHVDQKSIDNKQVTALWIASQEGHSDIVKWLIEERANINISSQDTGDTALHMAVQCNRLETVKLLLQNNVNANIANTQGLYPFQLATVFEYLDIIDFLLHYSDINQLVANDSKVNALHLAIESNKPKAVKFLIEKGININLINSVNGITALHLAIALKHKEIIKELLNGGADVKIINPLNGDSSVHYAMQLEDFDTLKIILDYGVDINTRNNEGETALFKAVLLGNKTITEFLLNNGAQANIPNKFGTYPIHIAATLSSSEIMLLLINSVDINQKTDNDFLATPIEFAVQEGILENVKIFADKGVNLNLVNSTSGNSLLHIAAEKYHVHITKELIIRGIGVNIRSKTGETPVYRAIVNNQLEILDLLLTNNGSLDIPDNNSTFPIHIAAVLGFLEIIKLLLDKGANLNLIHNAKGMPPLHLTMEQKHVEVAKELISRNVNINILDTLSNNSCLHWAVHLGDIEVLELLITKGINIDIRNNGGGTPLYGAVALNNENIVKLLLSHGAKVDIPNIEGTHPLYIATVNNSFDLIKLLLAHSSVTQKTDFGSLLLFAACYKECLITIKLLLDREANINALSNNNSTPLMVATINDKFEVVKLLLEHNADANIADNTGVYPLHIATCKNFLNIISVLISHCNINQTSNNEYKVTALWLASQDGKLEIVKLLADHGADINIGKADNGISPLCVSIQRQRFEVTKELLIRGADVNIKDNQELIALHYAVLLPCDLNITKAILDKTNDINSRDCQGATALYGATILNDKDKVQLLLEKGADANIPHSVGLYPWHIASIKGFKEIMQILKSKIPNIDYKTADLEQYTALWLASQAGHIEIVKWLIELDADINVAKQSDGCSAVHTAICGKHLQTVKLLIEKGVNVDKVDKHNYSLTYYAAEINDVDITKLLLERGANVNIAEDSGNQPIQAASFNANIDILKMLLDAGASVNSLNNAGYTPLHQLFCKENKNSNDDKLKTAKYLIEQGINAKVKDNAGKTAFDLAREVSPEILSNQVFLEILATTFEHDVNITGATL